MNVFANRNNAVLRFWWVLVLFGLLFIGTGIGIFQHFFVSFYSLNRLFMASMIVIGLVELLLILGNKTFIDNWEWYLINGSIDLTIGLLLLLIPDLRMALFHFIIPFWLIFRGISLFCIVYTAAKQSVRSRYWLLIMATSAIFCGVLLIWEPAVVVISKDWMQSIAFVAMGLMRITLGLRMRSYRSFYIHLLRKAA